MVKSFHLFTEKQNILQKVLSRRTDGENERKILHFYLSLIRKEREDFYKYLSPLF